MTDLQFRATELHWVAQRLLDGRAGESDIDILVTTILAIRAETPTTEPEALLAERYVAAKEAETLAAANIASHFWPLVKACTTEAEARALMQRVPGGAVEKAFFWDHFVYVSGVVPKAARA